MTPDAVFHNGTVLTLDDSCPETDTMVVRDGAIMALGDWDGSRRPDTREVDLAGRTVIPGLVDAHCHLVQHGVAERREAELRGAGSVEEILSRLTQHATDRDLSDNGTTWLLGRGFDQERLTERRWPTRDDLDALPWNGPVCLARVCGHARVISSRAQQVIRETHSRFPERASGLYTEDEQGPIFDAIPPPSQAEYVEAARWATAAAGRAGFTTVHCLVGSVAEIRALSQLHASGGLGCRIRVQLPYGLLGQLDELAIPRDDEWFCLGNVKLFTDGSLGARTAALSQPYHDDPTTSGERLMSAYELAEKVARIWQAGLQPCVHAIGDRAVDTVVEAYQRAAAVSPPDPGLRGRPRLEHASVVSPRTLEKLADMQIACCVQPQFVRSDWWTEERLGPERVRWAYPFRDMLDAGIPLLGGTDCPVEELNGMAALACAVARPGEDWTSRFRQELSVDDALRMFTLSAGEAGGEGEQKGALSPGKRADFLVLSEDPRAIPPKEIEHVVVEDVWIGGTKVA